MSRTIPPALDNHVLHATIEQPSALANPNNKGSPSQSPSNRVSVGGTSSPSGGHMRNVNTNTSSYLFSTYGKKDS
jgi:hypothetical protein